MRARGKTFGMHAIRVARPAAIVAAMMLSASCGTDPGAPSATDPAARSAADDVSGVTYAEFGHVHGLGINPADDQVYVAGHEGVFRLDEGGATQMAGRHQDTMGFTVTGPDTFIASGHPDPREHSPPHLGLIRSTDAAQTWETLSLSGEADFHAIETLGDRIYAYDSTQGRLMTSRGGREWTVMTTGLIGDIAVSDDGAVLFTDETGRVLSVDGASLQAVVSTTPALSQIDFTQDGTLVGANPGGDVYVSANSGDTWRAVEPLDGDLESLNAREDVWLAATTAGVFRSGDDGATWATLLAGDQR